MSQREATSRKDVARESDEFSIFAAAQEAGERIAIRAQSIEYSYKQLAELVKVRIQELETVHESTRPLILTAGKNIQTVVSIFAALQMHWPMVLVNDKLVAKERDDIERALRNINDSLPNGCAVILMTSGTTGEPKPVILTRHALRASAASCAANLALGPDDIWLMPLSPARVGGFSILTRSLAARSCVALSGRFSGSALAAEIASTRATIVSVVPAMLAKILQDCPKWKAPTHLRCALVGGSALPEKLWQRALDARIPIVTTYGMTETASNIVMSPYSERYTVQSGVGVTNPGVECRISEGEIFVRGEMCMSGYWGRERIQPGQWLDTGDMGEFDVEGRLHIKARRKELIITAGENVYPAEVERALEEIPGIAGARVIGGPDPVWGEVVSALLVPQDGVQVPVEVLRHEINARLSGGKRPRLYAWVESLPMTAEGKPDRSSQRILGMQLKQLHYSVPH